MQKSSKIFTKSRTIILILYHIILHDFFVIYGRVSQILVFLFSILVEYGLADTIEFFKVLLIVMIHILPYNDRDRASFFFYCVETCE